MKSDVTEKNASTHSITMAGSNPIVDTLMAINSESWRRNVAEAKARLMSPNERTSINALIAYVAMHSGESEFRIERRLADRFKVANIMCLPTNEFDNVIRYLVDALPKDMAF